ncbi:hypothetical protein BCR35DRAFT_306924 [Leucosporidium creatinivorum]|uniref:WW domain-containing protein n=1 Tax=Leucosporidium creatinivorum TaxID=106004 RepID=A0A1Y2EQF3_9BASI|nr:hypothetical protein BCR35DRAFT_306924 [Leucosporidium creatinivorum]
MSPSPPPTEPAPSNDAPVAEQPPLPPGTPPPVEAEAESGDASADGEAAEQEQGEKEGEAAPAEGAEDKDKESDPAAPGVHKGKEGWTAVWDPSSNAYYFYNSITNETTWTNPLEGGSDANAEASTSAAPAASQDSGPDFGGIDPELAFLDPTLSRQMTSGGGTQSFQARFNSRTGRFQGDPSMNPDRISDYSRGTRQQEVFYDTAAWAASLEGKGLKRAGESAEGSRKKKPSAAEVAAFKKKKEDKKKAKLMDFLKS